MRDFPAILGLSILLSVFFSPLCRAGDESYGPLSLASETKGAILFLETSFAGKPINAIGPEGSEFQMFSEAEGQKGDTEEWEEEEGPEEQLIADPLESINRAVFVFNDKLYFWVFKPLARGYRWILPEPARIGVQNFFRNVRMPIRAVNCVLQGKYQAFGNELLRFVVNTTAGFLGIADPAKTSMGIPLQDEDFGQTLAVWGMGTGFFVNLPFLGPSSARGTLGLGGDYFLNPTSYVSPFLASVGVKGVDIVNTTSLHIGEYEALKEAAIDPYVSLRDAYVQHRTKMISE